MIRDLIVDARFYRGVRNGNGNHLLGLVRGLSELDPAPSVRLYTTVSNRILAETPLPPNARRLAAFWPDPITRKRLWPSALGSLAPLDLVYRCGGVHSTLPEAIPTRRAPTSLTIHDLTGIRFPQYYYADVPATEVRRIQQANIRRADLVFTVSHAIAAEVAGEFGVARSSIHVLGNAPGEWTRHPLAAADADAFRTRYGLERPYLLCTATMEPRKRHDLLLAGFRLARERLGGELDLVLIGHPGWRSETLRAELGSAEARSGGIRWLGALADSELPGAYAGAAGAVLLSDYEGFGMPVLDALACGVPMLISSDPAMREVADAAALVVGERNGEAIADGIVRLISDSAMRESMVAGGLKRAEHYRWATIARTLLEAFG